MAAAVAALVASHAAAATLGPSAARARRPAKVLTNRLPLRGHESFVYLAHGRGTTPIGDPVVELRMAQLDRAASSPLAHDLKVLQDNNSMSDRIIFGGLYASPGNARALVIYDDLPIDAIDVDFQAYNLRTHATEAFFNDETAHTVIHKATCDSPKFDAYVESERMIGVPQSDLDQYDYQIDNGDGGVVGLVGWVDDEVFYIRWTFYIHSMTKGSMGIVQETFDLQVRMSGGTGTLVSCTAPGPLPGPPRPVHDLLPGNGPEQIIRLDRAPVLFYDPPSTSRPRKAIAAAGNIPK
jgi:hypothetical protein